MSTTNNVETLPPELLHNIFSLAADNYDPQQEPSMDGGDSPWSKDLRVKKTLILVCKAWRNAVLEMLYHRICLHRVWQIRALVKLLEAQVGYREWIHHIHGEFRVLWDWKKVYIQNIIKLLTMCSSCKTFSWRISWDIYAGHGGSVHEVDATGSCSTISVLRGIPTVQSSLQSIRKLSIRLDFVRDRDLDQDLSIVNLPNLNELVCEASLPDTAASLDIITRRFTIPNLRHLTLVLFHVSANLALAEAMVQSIADLLDRHGRKLSSLAMDMKGADYPIPKSLEDMVLRVCPEIVSLRLYTYALTVGNVAFTTPCFSLQRLELYVDIYVQMATAGTPLSDDPRSVEGFLSMAANRANFPTLQSIVLYDVSSLKILLGESMLPGLAVPSFQYFLSWTRRFREQGIALLREDNKQIISSDQERWGAWSRPEEGEGEPGEHGAA